MSRVWLVWAAAALLVLAPALANAQAADTAAAGPSLNCSLVGLRILTDELNAARLVCGVSGAPTSDSTFTVSVLQPLGAAQPKPLCADGLNAGVGTCSGGLFDPATELSVTATLEPSGLTLGPVSIVPTVAPPAMEAPPMQFYPLGD